MHYSHHQQRSFLLGPQAKQYTHQSAPGFISTVLLLGLMFQFSLSFYPPSPENSFSSKPTLYIYQASLEG